MEKINEYLQIAQEKVIFFVPKVLLAVAILWIDFKVIKKLVKLFELALKKKWNVSKHSPFFNVNG